MFFRSDPLVISELVGLVFTAWMIWVPSVAPLSLDGDGEESDPRLATPTATVTNTGNGVGTGAGTGTRSEFPSAPSSSSSSSSSHISDASLSHSRSHSHSSALSFEAVDEASNYGDNGGEAVSVGGAVRVARAVAPAALGAHVPASALSGCALYSIFFCTHIANMHPDILASTFIV
jgi:hypothetical protein